jgi:uncharacterized protein DUF4395
MNTTVDCPVDFIPVNENKVRLTALWVLILVLISFFALPLWITKFLVLDFFLRGYDMGKYSPLNALSGVVVKLLHISNKPIDQAPKRFAAKIGFVLSVVVAICLLTDAFNAALIFRIIFAVFAFLESFLGFCAGCYVYSFFKQLKLKK